MNGMGYRLRWMDDIDIDVDVRGMSIFTSSDQRIDAALTLRYVSFTFHRSSLLAAIVVPEKLCDRLSKSQ